MSQNNLEMNLNLHDNFTRVMNKAKEATEQMEKHLERANEFSKTLIESFGAGLAIFEGFNFVKEGLSEFRKINIETAVLTNELKNQGKYSKELVDNLKEGREELAKLGFYKEGETLRFQELMMKQFPNSNEEYRKLYTETAANLANGGSLQEGQEKLNHLIAPRIDMKTGGIKENYRALFKEMGLGGFEKLLPEIENAYKKGHDTRAELTEILSRLPDLKNNARIRAENDPELKAKILMEKFGETLGHLTNDVENAFLPDIEKAVEWLDDMVKNHFQQIKNIAIDIVHGLKFVAEIMAGKFIYNTISGFITGIGSLSKGIIELLGLNTLEKESEGQVVTGLNLLAASAERAAISLDLIGGNPSEGHLPKTGLPSGGSSLAGIIATSALVLQAAVISGAITLLVGQIGEHYGWFGKKYAGNNRSALEAIGLGKNRNSPEELLYQYGAGGLSHIPELQNLKLGDKDHRHSEEEKKGILTIQKAAQVWGGYNRLKFDENGNISNSEPISGLFKNLKETFDMKEFEGFKKAIKENTKMHSGDKPKTGDKPSGGVMESTVKGQQTKIINLNFNRDFIKLDNTYNNVTESAADIEHIITQAIIDGVNAAELLLSPQ